MTIPTPFLAAFAVVDALSWIFVRRRYRRERRHWQEHCMLLRSELEKQRSTLALPPNVFEFLRAQADTPPDKIDGYEFAFQSGLGAASQMREDLVEAVEIMKKQQGRILRLVEQTDSLFDENVDLHSVLMSARAWADAMRGFLIDGTFGDHQLTMLDIILRAKVDDEGGEAVFLGVELWECATYDKDHRLHDVEIALGKSQAERWLADREAEKAGTKPIDPEEQGCRRRDNSFVIEPATVVRWKMPELVDPEEG